MEEGEVFEFAPFVVRVGEEAVPEVPHPLSAVGGETIQRGNRQVALDEALEGIPGVFVLNPHNFAQDTRIAIRGFGARADFGIRGIRLLVDGIPATSPDGQGEVDGIDLGSAGRIRVLRGPASVFYGPASGGVILIDTEQDQGMPFSSARLSLGEDGFRHLQVKAGGQAGDLGALLSLSHFRTDGHRAHSETENRRLNGKITYRSDPGKQLRLVFNVIDYPLQNDPGGLTREEAKRDPARARDRNLQYDAGESVSQQRFGIQYGQSFEGGGNLELTVHATRRDFANRLPFSSGGQVELDREVSGARLVLDKPFGELFLSAGAELGYQDDDRRNFDNLEGQRGERVLDQREEVDNLGFFLYGRGTLPGGWLVSAALRYDTLTFEVTDSLLADGNDSGRIDFTEWSPMLGLSHHLGEGHLLYTNLTTSFETPTTTEFDNPEGGGFNTELDSQLARNVELGLRGRFRVKDLAWDYDLALFRIDIEDLLVPFELPGSPGREFYRNAGEGLRKGLEIAAGTRLTDWLQVRFDYTYSDFTYENYQTPDGDFSGNRIPGIPRHFGGVSLKVDTRTGFFADWRTTFTGTFYADDANAERISPVSVSRLTLGWRWSEAAWLVEPFLRIDNLFKESYFANIRLNAFGGRHFEPAPGRRIFWGIRLRGTF
jgi:iron complex outermembrane receptor protein